MRICGGINLNQISFKIQGYISLAILICGLFLEQIFKMGVFHNIAWILIGLLFVVNPVWPKMWDWRNHDDLRKGIRIGSALVIIIFGFMTRYRV